MSYDYSNCTPEEESACRELGVDPGHDMWLVTRLIRYRKYPPGKTVTRTLRIRTSRPVTMDEVRNAIEAAPHDHLGWDMMRDELRILDKHMEINAHRSSCWKRRQYGRLIQQFTVAAHKGIIDYALPS